VSIDLKAHRQKLIDQGAVSMFHEKSDTDQAADRATHGLPPGMPGLGLYRISEGVYEAHVEAYHSFAGFPDFNTFTADQWREYLTTREPRATYTIHRTRSGNVPFYWRHVIVEFRIEVSK
jgi:hypothetical protein